MRLINPQPMETLPEDGEVYVEWEMFGVSLASTVVVHRKKVENIRYFVQHGVQFLAWSYAATSKTEGEG